MNVLGNANEVCNKQREEYLKMSSATRTIYQFVKIAYPDLIKAQGPDYLEPLYDKDQKVCRSVYIIKLFTFKINLI